MLDDIKKLKDFCKEYSDIKKSLNLSDNAWDRIDECILALKPAKIATLTMQKEQLLPGDFYGCWLRCKLELKNLDSKIAKTLLKNMEVREQKLFNNDLFLAGLYLDPRYLVMILSKDNTLNTNSQEYRARQKLLDIWKRLQIIEKRVDAFLPTATVQMRGVI